jgi:hypothetical protein
LVKKKEKPAGGVFPDGCGTRKGSAGQRVGRPASCSLIAIYLILVSTILIAVQKFAFFNRNMYT